MREYKGSLSDQWYEYKYWCKTYGEILKFTASGPIPVLKALLKYPWIYDLLKINATAKRVTLGISGTPMKALDNSIYHLTKFIVGQLKNAVFDPENTVVHDVMLPPLIVKAMHLNTLVPEAIMSVGVAMCDIHAAHSYMDYMVNHGLPADTCTFPKIATGAVVSGQFPSASCIISSNLPCDSGQSSYYAMQRKLNLPMYTVDIPYNFNEEEGIDAVKEDWYGAIKFLEKHTGHKMDWDRLKVLCENYNKKLELELEEREMLRTDRPPLAGAVIQRNHTVHMNVNGGSEEAVEAFQETYDLMKNAFKNGELAVKNLRYRAVLWNPTTMCYYNWMSWIEQVWGVAILADMETYGNEKFIDTSSNDAMMSSIAFLSNSGPMSRHTRGSQEHYIRDFNKMAQDYNADFVIVAAHMSCRNSQAMTGIIREECKKHNMPLCMIDYELFDNRIVSRQGIRDQISNFMRTVMHAEPLNESLLVIDDEKNW